MNVIGRCFTLLHKSFLSYLQWNINTLNAQFNHKYTIYPSGCCSYDTNYNCFVFRLDPTAVFYQPKNDGTNDEDVTITHSMEAEYADVEESIMVCISV